MKKMEVTWEEVDLIFENIEKWLKPDLIDKTISEEEFWLIEFKMTNFILNTMLEVVE